MVPELRAKLPLKPLLDGIEPEQSRREQEAESTKTKVSLQPQPLSPHRPISTPWLAGSFYLFVLAFSAAVFAVVYHYVGLASLPIIALAVVLVFALANIQLFQGGTLSEAGFLQLMAALFKNLQQFGQGDKGNQPPNNKNKQP